MFVFWQRSHESIENLCTFTAETCLDCARLTNPGLRVAARPICIASSHLFTIAQEHIDEGNPYASNLPEWFPSACPYHMAI